MIAFKHLVFLATFATFCAARHPRIGLFNVVSFPNDVCVGSGTMNGTCYTEEECSNKDGVASGSCADGFGVCCVISLSCGDTTSDNCTYLTQTSTTTPGTGCSYTICPASSSVNRIRLELTTFSIASPVTLAAADFTGTATAAAATQTAAIGHCATDSFSATGAPVICGVNSGQHMVLDTDGTQCVTATFSYGGDTATRQYNIHVIQYERLSEMGGPAGCLQYFTTNTGTFSSFNFQTDATPGGGNIGSPHLPNQDYSVCIRQNADRCAICYSAIISYIAVTITNTFGLSIASGNVQTGVSGATCTGDHVYIPNGLNSGMVAVSFTAAELTNVVTQNPAAGTPLNPAAGSGRYCGRILGPQAGTVSHTVCSRLTPFIVGVFTDDVELIPVAGGAAMQLTNEVSTIAANMAGSAGTYGFALGFDQRAC